MSALPLKTTKVSGSSALKTQLESTLKADDAGFEFTIQGGATFRWNGTSFDQISTNGAAHVTSGGPGGTANTAITSFPFTMFTHSGTGTGTAYNLPSGRVTIQASSDASHANSSIIDIEVSNDNVGWEWIARLTVTGNSDTALASIDDNYAYIRSNCTQHGDATNDVTVTINL